jgi:hypothetical protein
VDRLYQQGLMANRAGKLVEAEQAYRSALALRKSHDIAANLGLVELKLGKHRDAAEHLAFALRHSPPSDGESIRTKIRQRLDEAMASVGTLRVKAGVPGAEIVIDGTVVGTEPLEGEVFVEPGAHTIEARLVGYKGAPQAVTVAKGQSVDVALTLVKSASTVEGSGTAGGPGGGKPVVVDGPNKGLIIAGIASSVAAAGAGIGFAVVSNGKGSTADERLETLRQQAGNRSPCRAVQTMACEEVRGLIVDRDLFGNLAAWSFLISGAVGAGTAIYLLTAAEPGATRSITVAPAVTYDAAGLMLTGAW